MMSTDEKLDLILEKLQNMNCEMHDVKADIQNIKSDILNMDAKIDNLNQRVTSLELKLEKEIGHNIQLLAENHCSLTDKLNQAIKVSDKNTLWEVQLSGFRMRLEKLEDEFAEWKNRLAGQNNDW